MRTRANNPNGAVVAQALRPGVDPYIRRAIEIYLCCRIRGIETFDDQARALNVGRSTWQRWRRALGWPPPRTGRSSA